MFDYWRVPSPQRTNMATLPWVWGWKTLEDNYYIFPLRMTDSQGNLWLGDGFCWFATSNVYLMVALWECVNKHKLASTRHGLLVSCPFIGTLASTWSRCHALCRLENGDVSWSISSIGHIFDSMEGLSTVPGFLSQSSIVGFIPVLQVL
jgi:hypothetical protein